jgi:hypothetical protein
MSIVDSSPYYYSTLVDEDVVDGPGRGKNGKTRAGNNSGAPMCSRHRLA